MNVALGVVSPDNKVIESLAKEQFFHADYDATLVDTYGEEYKEELVVEGGVTE